MFKLSKNLTNSAIKSGRYINNLSCSFSTTSILASTSINSNSNNKSWNSFYLLAGAIGLTAAGLSTNQTYCDAEKPAPPGHPAAILPTISLEEFRKDRDGRIWVTMDGGVYDVTPFLDAHPGGAERIQMVHGSDLQKFWQVYQLHDRPHIRSLLEEYRIGNLTAADYKTVKSQTKFANSYTEDPVRPQKANLRVPSIHPWNSEPATLSVLSDNFYTPNDLFFVRNHNPVPVIDEKEWVLTIEANEKAGLKETTFTLAELKNNFKPAEVISALQCAGNRQEDYVTEDRPLYVAPHWRNGAIGNAKWTGVRVRDLLGASGMPVDSIALREQKPGGKIVNFIASDTDETGTPYAGVIPIEKAIDPYGDAILAYEMNGEELPRDHGYPVRLLAPGHAGCRNVKWVSTISVTDAPSELDSGSRLDRHYAPDVRWHDHKDHTALSRCPKPDGSCQTKVVRTDQGPVIQTLPVQSIVCVPANRSVISGNCSSVTVKGVAWSGAGRGICRVEVSVDGGKTFSAAELNRPPSDAPTPEQGMGRNWAWNPFTYEVHLSEEIKAQLQEGKQVDMTISSKAIDGDFNSQPEHMTHGWNVLGICVNHWSTIHVTLDPKLPCGIVKHPPATPLPGSPYWGDGTHQNCGSKLD